MDFMSYLYMCRGQFLPEVLFHHPGYSENVDLKYQYLKNRLTAPFTWLTILTGDCFGNSAYIITMTACIAWSSLIFGKKAVQPQLRAKSFTSTRYQK